MKQGAMRQLWVGLCLTAGLWLSGCGGGGGDTTPTPAPVGKVSGTAVASDDSSPLANAKVSVAGMSTRTAADGSFTIDAVPAADRQVLSIEADGFVDGKLPVPVAANQTARATARLVRAASATTVDAAAAATVTAPNSTAAVDLAANSLVNASSGAAATGAVTVRVTPIDPAADPQSMPGDYTTPANTRIESFGAVEVSLKDASGAKLNLKAGSSATLRIPLSSRSANPPSTIPLFYLDEATGRWVEQGSATLKGTEPNRYYEGTVTHFSYWNADQVQDTIFVNGCVVDKAAKPVVWADVQSVGLDYSGSAYAPTDAQGKFRVAIRKSSRAQVFAEFNGGYSNTVVVGPSEVDITLPECLVIDTAPVAPIILTPPESQTVDDGTLTCFSVVANGTRPLTYQWKRDGVAIAGASYPWYCITASTSGVFTVDVSNTVGTVTSAAATLTVTPPTAPTLLVQPQSVSVTEGDAASFFVVTSGSTPISFQWLRNGVAIDGATGLGYTLATTSAADNTARFSVRVSNRAGTVTSAEATLTVKPVVLKAPEITRAPGNVTVNEGQPATFIVLASGTPKPTYQWKRNGVDIAGATATTYTTPLTALADSGYVYTVVVSNSQGSVTSPGATLTVLVGTQTDSFALMRLLGLSFDFYEAAYLPFMATNDAGTAFIDPASVCSVSGTLAVKLNGTTVTAGGAFPASGTLAGTASACNDGTSAYTGSSSVVFNFSATNPTVGTATATVSNMRVLSVDGNGTVQRDITANGGGATNVSGSVSGANTTQIATLTPAVGATLKSGVSGLTATFAGGSVSTQTTQVTLTDELKQLRVTYSDMRFSVSGVSYLANGFYELNFAAPGTLPTGAGEVVLSSNGVRVGRLFIDANGMLAIEVNGTVQPFGGATRGLRAR